MENKKFYVTIKGKQIEVTEEVYRAYVRPIRNEQRQKRRDWKCKVVGPKGNLIRCPNKCEECPYAKAGKPPKGNNLSLDELKECGVEIVDESMGLEMRMVDMENKNEELKALYAAIEMLTPRQKEMVKMVYFEGKTQEEVARIFQIDGSSVRHAMARIYGALRKFLEKNK